MKRSELFFSAIQVPIDFAMILLAAISAFSIRNIPEFLALKPKLYNYPFETYIKIVLIVIPLFILIYALEGLYDIRVTRKFWKETLKVFNATSIGLVVIIVTIFLKREWFSSRFIILSAWGLAVIYVVLARYFLQVVQKWLLVNRQIGVHRVLLIGRNGKIRNLSEMISQRPLLGFQVVDWLDNASIKNIKKIKKERGIDEIILCEPTLTDDEQEKLIDYCAIQNIKFRYIPTTLQTSKFGVGILNGEPLLKCGILRWMVGGEL